MALRSLFRTLAHDRDCLLFRQDLEQSQRELLPVILDETIPIVDRSVFEEFFSIAPPELDPAKLLIQESPKQLLTRAQIRHPNIIAA